MDLVKLQAEMNALLAGRRDVLLAVLRQMGVAHPERLIDRG